MVQFIGSPETAMELEAPATLLSGTATFTCPEQNWLVVVGCTTNLIGPLLLQTTAGLGVTTGAGGGVHCACTVVCKAIAALSKTSLLKNCFFKLMAAVCKGVYNLTMQ